MNRSLPHSLSIADRAFLRALASWGEPGSDRVWDRLGAPWRQTLRDGWLTLQGEDPDAARGRLQTEHAAQARPDFRRIHGTWLVRALKDETPAVQRAVAAHAPDVIRERLDRGLGLTVHDRSDGAPPHPEALRCAVALWTERLVGDLAERDDDPPVVVALTRVDLRSVGRLLVTVAQVKRAVAADDPARIDAPIDQRAVRLRASFSHLSARLRELARLDLERHGSAGRHANARLGLVTIARLLENVEPYRARWALQHLPYDSAKLARSLMNPRPRRESSLAAWETAILKAAWDQLHREGRFNVAWEDRA